MHKVRSGKQMDSLTFFDVILFGLLAVMALDTINSLLGSKYDRSYVSDVSPHGLRSPTAAVRQGIDLAEKMQASMKPKLDVCVGKKPLLDVKPVPSCYASQPSAQAQAENGCDDCSSQSDCFKSRKIVLEPKGDKPVYHCGRKATKGVSLEPMTLNFQYHGETYHINFNDPQVVPYPMPQWCADCYNGLCEKCLPDHMLKPKHRPLKLHSIRDGKPAFGVQAHVSGGRRVLNDEPITVNMGAFPTAIEGKFRDLPPKDPYAPVVRDNKLADEGYFNWRQTVRAKRGQIGIRTAFRAGYRHGATNAKAGKHD